MTTKINRTLIRNMNIKELINFCDFRQEEIDMNDGQFLIKSLCEKIKEEPDSDLENEINELEREIEELRSEIDGLQNDEMNLKERLTAKIKEVIEGVIENA